MSYESVLRKYYQAVERQDPEQVLKLFSKNGVVIHPIFGNQPVGEFFKMLLKDLTAAHKIHVRNIFTDVKQPNRVAVYFTAETIKTSKGKQFEMPHGVHIFDFSSDGTIDQIIVIFDTYHMRGFFR